jgi:hypothetical protein
MVGVQTMMRFHIVQPFGADRTREATVVSTHASVEAAYAELDRIAARLNSHGLVGDVIELLVVGDERRSISRPGAH